MTSALPRIGVRLPNSGPFATSSNLIRTAELAETLGYDRVWVHDHISWARDKLSHFATGSLEACEDQDPNFFESTSTCAFLLGRLARIGIGIAGLVLPLRDARVLAKQLAAMEQLGDSRLIVAASIGAIEGDFEVMGKPFKKRGKITTDQLGALRTSFSAKQPVSFTSETVSFDDATLLPAPKRLPLWVTASSEPGLRRAIRFGDGWLTVYRSVREYDELVERLRELASAESRDMSSFECGYETFVSIGDTTAEAIAVSRRSLVGKFDSLSRGLDVSIIGDVTEVLDKAAAYHKRGADHLEVKFIAHDVEQLHWMMEELANAAGLCHNNNKER